MGIEPTMPLLAQSIIGFEDRGRHQSDARFHARIYHALMRRTSLSLAVVAALAVSSRSADAFDTWWHAEATRHAMDENGFSGNARLVVQVENYLTDLFAALSSGNAEYGGVFKKMGWPVDPAYDHLHFDAVFSEKDIEHNWEQLQKNTLAALQKY